MEGDGIRLNPCQKERSESTIRSSFGAKLNTHSQFFVFRHNTFFLMRSWFQQLLFTSSLAYRKDCLMLVCGAKRLATICHTICQRQQPTSH